MWAVSFPVYCYLGGPGRESTVVAKSTNENGGNKLCIWYSRITKMQWDTQNAQESQNSTFHRTLHLSQGPAHCYFFLCDRSLWCLLVVWSDVKLGCRSLSKGFWTSSYARLWIRCMESTTAVLKVLQGSWDPPMCLLGRCYGSDAIPRLCRCHGQRRFLGLFLLWWWWPPEVVCKCVCVWEPLRCLSRAPKSSEWLKIWTHSQCCNRKPDVDFDHYF